MSHYPLVMEPVVYQLSVCLMVGMICACVPKRPEKQLISQRLLNVQKLPQRAGQPFTRGSTFEMVKSTMGSPEITQDRAADVTIWNYKFSTITFRKGRVESWNNASKNLRCAGKGEEEEELAEHSLPSKHPEGEAVNLSPELASSINGSVPSTRPGQTSSSTQKVQGYQKADGSVVSGYIRTTADSSRSNNYSTRGNVNPYTSKRGNR
jgi:hypothetical protein